MALGGQRMDVDTFNEAKLSQSPSPEGSSRSYHCDQPSPLGGGIAVAAGSSATAAITAAAREAMAFFFETLPRSTELAAALREDLVPNSAAVSSVGARGRGGAKGGRNAHSPLYLHRRAHVPRFKMSDRVMLHQSLGGLCAPPRVSRQLRGARVCPCELTPNARGSSRLPTNRASEREIETKLVCVTGDHGHK